MQALDLMREGCWARASRVSTAISTSSGDVMALMVEGPLGAEESWGGVGGPFCLMEMEAWALLRLRLAMVMSGDGVCSVVQGQCGMEYQC